jgi:ATP-dependent DNA ligase
LLPFSYLTAMRKTAFEPCIPTRGTKVPAGPDWLHEIKHDGYRLIVQRDGPRVRLFTRRGFDWSDRFPLISAAARRLRPQSFVIDGEAVWLDGDGVSQFDRLHSRKHHGEVRLIAFDLLAVGDDDIRAQPLHARKDRLASIARKLKRSVHAITSRKSHLNQGRVVGQFDCWQSGCLGICQFQAHIAGMTKGAISIAEFAEHLSTNGPGFITCSIGSP